MKLALLYRHRCFLLYNHPSLRLRVKVSSTLVTSVSGDRRGMTVTLIGQLLVGARTQFPGKPLLQRTERIARFAARNQRSEVTSEDSGGETVEEGLEKWNAGDAQIGMNRAHQGQVEIVVRMVLRGRDRVEKFNTHYHHRNNPFQKYQS